ncbi:unnamed protein product, partial [Dibothriocephalus latus]
AQATNSWYSEGQHYDYNGNTQQGCGHFTQVIWKGSEKAGFGVARSKDKKSVYVVGRYFPPGNYQNEYKKNVPPPVA